MLKETDSGYVASERPCGTILRKSLDTKAGTMAQYSPYDTTCSICEVDLSGNDDNITTPRFITDRAHPLYRFTDTVMHRACFIKWEHREAFVQSFNENADRRQSQLGMDSTGTIVGRTSG